MNRTEAGSTLQGRRRRLHRKKSGPNSLQFTAKEIDAVRVMAFHGVRQSVIASKSGLTISQFEKALQKDEKLHDAWKHGRDRRLRKRFERFEKHFEQGSDRAGEVLLKYDDKIEPTTGRPGSTTNVQVNVNNDSAQKAIDGRTYVAALNRINTPVVPASLTQIEPTRGEIIDPVKAGLAHMKEKK